MARAWSLFRGRTRWTSQVLGETLMGEQTNSQLAKLLKGWTGNRSEAWDLHLLASPYICCYRSQFECRPKAEIRFEGEEDGDGKQGWSSRVTSVQ